MSSNSDRKIRDVRDLWGCKEEKENPRPPEENSNGILVDNRTKHKYKTLERHLSMKKTVRKKMMRDLKEIGDASTEESNQPVTFLEQLKAEQPPPPNIDKPSLWKRLTKGWGHS
ncbi:uncharacterized protein LOC108741168 [Agrilus planipennis]|uniref:Uncharacterized protein LOC108741168 n=1 Tax=Agrilus planipennis TaxID=224129 RepID=A0A1W4XF18_AGRPL|nr:uncharacterized protein LOC108741168 [Agrilus planipennis]XP_018331357.1 uncharacterized protein LOC108741168 [Agrilus planipennis]